ncbi:MAG: hypothetical protein QOJ67_1985 [Acidimicrobiaceae bacterium]
MKPPKPVIGWREWVGLPDLGVDWMKAKVDTGARSSSLHAWDVEIAGDVVRFNVHPVQDDDEVVVQAEAELVEHRDVRSSNGDVEVRPVIRTVALLRGERIPIELTLSRRDEMGFRMLLGRSAVRRRFLVDPGRSFLGGGDRVSRPPGPSST